MANCALINIDEVIDYIDLRASSIKDALKLSELVENQFGSSLEEYFKYLSEDEQHKNSLENLLGVFEYYSIDVTNIIELKNNDSKGTQNNINSKFLSSEVEDLFHTMSVAKNHFEQQMKSKLMSAISIGKKDAVSFVSGSKEINENIKEFKNELFKIILEFNKSEDIDIKLYDKNGKFITENYNKYKVELAKLEKTFFESDTIRESYNGRKIPNLRGSILNQQDLLKFNAYNAAIMLVKFDNFIKKLMNNVVTIDYSVFNKFNDNPGNTFKYKLNTKGKETDFHGDKHEHESVETLESSLAKNLVSTIPQRDKQNNSVPGFLEMKDFYALGGLFKDLELENFNTLNENQDWDLLQNNPKKMIKWYLDKIIKAKKDNFKNNPEFAIFSSKMELIYSLDHYLTDNNIYEKENNENQFSVISVLSQIINNTFGANYLIYNKTGKYEIDQMYKHNASKIHAQNGIYANIVSKFKIADTLFDTKSKSFEDLFSGINLKESLLKKDDDNIYSIIESSELYAFKTKFNKFMFRRFGFGVNSKVFNEIIIDKDKKNSENTGLYTLLNLKEDLIKLFTSVNKILPDIKENEKLAASTNKDQVLKESEILGDVLSDSLLISSLNAYVNNYITKVIMTVSNLKGDKIPTFKTATLMQNDVNLLMSHKKNYENNPNNIHKSLFLGKVNSLIGTGTRLEIRSKKGNQVDAANMSVSENIDTTLIYDFYKSLTLNKGRQEDVNSFSVVIGNYSDKSTILTKFISENSTVLDSEGKEKLILKMSNEELLELFRVQTKNHYADVLNDIFKQYTILFNTNGIKGFNTLNNPNDKIKFINNYLTLETFNKDRVNAFKNGANFTEELHYTTYKNLNGSKRLALNQQIVDHYNIFEGDTPSKNFLEFIKNQEESFIKKYINANKGSNKLHFNEEDLADFYKVVNLKNPNKKGKEIKPELIAKGKELNPLIKKWLWTTNLFKNEYLYISAKGEYTHPHKNKDLEYRGDADKIDFEKLSIEMEGRLSSMAKRNVLFTATIELPNRDSKWSTPNNVNLAVINDYTSQMYNESGETKNGQEIHDGSSAINYVYGKLVEKSYPDKNYKGTKKQFGTFVTEHSVAIKKDAETVITNDLIRNSNLSKIKYRNKQKQSFNAFYLPVDLKYDKTPSNLFIYHNGIKKQIDSYDIKNGILSIFFDDSISPDIKVKVNTLFDVWENLGGEYSMNENGDFSEGSNEELFDLVVDKDLREDMIHIISNKSAIKMGATNINTQDSWINDGDLMYTRYENKHMGPQLDANHEADESQIKEITQVVSALSQNGNTAHLAQEIYENLAKIIQKSAESYDEFFKAETDKNDLYNYMSRKFIDKVSKEQTPSLAKSILESLPDELQIPFSNQNFFEKFTKDVITRMNNEFITRYYKGIGAVLNPSHGIVQLFEDRNGNILKQEDLAKAAFADYQLNGGLYPVDPTNDQIIKTYLEKVYPPELVDSDTIQPGDTYLTEETTLIKDYLTHADGITIVEVENEHIVQIPNTLDTIEKYYKFKRDFAGKQVMKSFATARDLKPSEITFKLENKILKEPYSKAWDDDSSKINQGYSYALSSKPNERFTLTEDIEKGYYSIHFKTSDKNSLTREEKSQLFEIISLDLPIGAKLSTYGSVTKGGFSGINKFLQYGFEESSELREVIDRETKEKVKIPILIKTSEHDQNTKTYNSKNIFDTDSIRLRYVLNTIKENVELEKNKKPLKEVNQKDLLILNKFATDLKIDNSDFKIYFKQLDKLLNAWTQRNLQLLDKGMIMKEVDENTDFTTYFNGDNLVSNIFEDVEHLYENNTIIVQDYVHKAAELILPNIYKSDFEVDKDSINTIKSDPNYFKNKLLEQYNKEDENSDFIIVTDSNESNVHVKYVDSFPSNVNSNIGVSVIKDRIKSKDKNTERIYEDVFVKLDSNGQKQFILPKNSRIIKNDNGTETLYIKAVSKKAVKLATGSKRNYEEVYEINPNINKILNNLISSFEGNIKAIVPTMNSSFKSKDIITNEDGTEEIKIGLLDIHKITLNLFSKFTGQYVNLNNFNPQKVKFLYESIKNQMIDNLATKRRISWEKSQEFVAARIPAQSMQSFMTMKNVGYNNTDSNDAYVSVWQVWLQGSDFDIDKAYILGYGFNKNGEYETNAPLKYNSLEQLNELEKLPLPNNKVWSEFTKKGVKTEANLYKSNVKGLDISKEFEAFTSIYLENDGYTEENFVDDILSDIAKKKIKKEVNKKAFSIHSNFTAEQLKILNIVLRKINNNESFNISLGANLFHSQFADDFIKLINDYNKNTSYVSKKYPILNSVVSGIKRVSSMPSNLLLSNTPIDVSDWQDVATKGLEKRESENESEKLYLSSLDGISWMQQQYDAAVGKDDVGIAANGLKVYFALTSYYNNYYSKDLPIIDNDPKLFNKQFVINNKSFNISTISDVKIRNKQIQELKNKLKGINSELEDIKLDVLKSNAALAMSGFTSLATDNAKELAMAKLNASKQLASMHLYMMTLGIEKLDIALFMNSKIALHISKELESNLFIDDEKTSNFVNSIISRYKKDLKEKGLESDSDLLAFESIYSGAQEFTTLSSFLGVNQKRSANTIELNKFLMNLEKAMFTRESAIFGFKTLKLRTFNDGGELSKEDNEIIDDILKNNKFISREKVISVLDRVKNAGMIGGQFDFRKFVDKKNPDYKKIAKEYYNLIKDTFNIFDVIDEVPHFKAMIDGIIISHNILLNSSKKYNFVFNFLRDVISYKSDEIQSFNSEITHFMGNSAFPLLVDKKVLGKTYLGFDKFLVGSWLKYKSDDKKSPQSISFNVAELLKLSGEKSIELYNKDSQFNLDSKTLIELDDNNELITDNSIITLDTDYGIANFKKVMETLILPILRKRGRIGESFVNSLSIKNLRTSYGFSMSSIVPAFSMSQLNSPVNLDKFQELLNNFNDLDLKINKLQNTEGVDLNWRDLFYTYNLLVNNEAYGDLRLTPIFEDYIKEPNSIGRNFILFSNKVDSGEYDLFDHYKDLSQLKNKKVLTADEEKEVNLAKENMYNSIMFYAYNTNGQLFVKKLVNSRNSRDSQRLAIIQPDFVVNTSFEPISLDKEKSLNIGQIIKFINANALIVTIECK